MTEEPSALDAERARVKLGERAAELALAAPPPLPYLTGPPPPYLTGPAAPYLTPPAPAAQPATAGEPSDDVAATPRRVRRIFRPAVVWSIVGAIVVAGNVWMYVIIDGWRADEAGLREQAGVSANSIEASDATIAFQSDVLSLLAGQSNAATAWSVTLQDEADAATARADAYKEVGLGFERCGDRRAEAIAAIWAGGSGSASLAAADAECSAAQQALDALVAGS